MKTKFISPATVKRLPRYYRYVLQLEKQGIKKVSSKELANTLDFTASQVRQDFCQFGSVGQQGYGYDISILKETLLNILGLNREYDVVIVGAGNIGKAVANYPGFKNDGFKIKAIFDVEPGKLKNYDIKMIEDLTSYVETENVDIAVLAVPMDVAQDVATIIEKSGIKAIWNFSAVDINVSEDTIVENIFMSDSLYILSYMIDKKQ